MLKDILHFQGTWRSYQQRVLDQFDSYIADQNMHIVAAPGSGKTTLGIEIIKRINKPTLVLTPTITIREQWVSRISEAFLTSPDTQQSYLSQDLKKPGLLTVTTYQALYSAMTKYRGELSEEETDDPLKTETVDFQDFDVVKLFQEHNLGTICLDECHHLRSEWWRSLEEFKQAFPDIFTVSLTATPPYDSTPTMWKRYINMCGEIDEEITVPELVKDGTLCPHQDFVYFNYPTRKEQEQVKIFQQNANLIYELLMQSEVFETAIKNHKFFTGDVPADELLADSEYLSAMIVFLNEKKDRNANKYQKLLGYKTVEPMSIERMEVLLQHFLYDDVASYPTYEDFQNQLKKDLKAHGLIERKTVTLKMNKPLKNLLVQSMGKCESIKAITTHEFHEMGKNLRLLILTDYIRKEYEKALGDETRDVNNLGVLPFFELIRRESVLKNPSMRLGVLCGSMVIIPAEAKEALLSLVEKPERISFQKAGQLLDYVKVEVTGNAHFLTQAITELFSQGYIHVMIGTKSLLGEGWDSPCINSLILASFVGSYMLSNQMRGRAIRVLKDHPEKTSNIWHLVCIGPGDKFSQEITNAMSEDFQTLIRRMNNFMGLDYENDYIESGVIRIKSAIQLPITNRNIKKTNQNMLALSSERSLLGERWKRALEIQQKMEVAETIEVPEKQIYPIVLSNALRAVTLLLIGCIMGAIFAAIETHNRSSPYPISTWVGMLPSSVVYVLYFILRVKHFWTFRNPLSCLKSYGLGIRDALEKTNHLESINSRVQADNDALIIYLLGGTGHDKSLFATCVEEFFSPIDNQRYILYNPKHKKRLDGYFPVPEIFSTRKEEALAFAQSFNKFAGNYELIYTRNEAGRKILLQGRIYGFANRHERCLTRKKLKGALD